jgi:AcrR family transcriptional regulator
MDSAMSSRQPHEGPRPYRLGKRADAVAATRERILEAGWAEVERAGYRPASVEAIADRAGITRMTVYRHFPSRGELLEAIAWHRISKAQLDRLDAARNDVDVATATRRFLLENCLLLAETGTILRAMLDVEREEPELAAALDVTYRGRRIQSVRELARRIVESPYAVEGWTVEKVADALTVLTAIETYETLADRSGRTPHEAAQLLFAMTSAFLRAPRRRARRRDSSLGRTPNV